jgi:hypothetical protein
MNKRAQSAAEVSVLIFLIGLFMVGYIILLPEDDRNALLNEDYGSSGDSSSGALIKTLLSEAPGKVSSTKSATKVYSLEPMRLYSTSESATQKLASSMTVSRSIIQNNYKSIKFDIENLDQLEDMSLLFLITESKGTLTIELNNNVVYQGEVSSGDLPIDLGTSNLESEDNVLRMTVEQPAWWKLFSSNRYILQDVELIQDYTVADTVSSRTFSVDNPDDVTSADLRYFVTCNNDENGILTIYLNNREVFSDRVFCEYLEERDLALKDDYIGSTNTLKFEITKGDYNIEEIQVDLKTKNRKYPSFTFDVSTDLYDNIKSEEEEVFLKFTFGDETSEKVSKVLVNEHEFSFNTENGEYEKEITSMIDNGANTVTLQPETSFEIDNIKVYSSKA